MNIGNKISELRKKNNLSQEELAEIVGVTRQTISKWELAETSPDIKQAKIIAESFNVSLDWLVNNDVKTTTMKSKNNIIKIILLIIFMIIVVLLLCYFFGLKRSNDREVVGKYTLSCTIDGEKYIYGVEYNKNFIPLYSGGDAYIPNHIDVEKFNDANQIKAHIEDYFKDHNGQCIELDNK